MISYIAIILFLRLKIFRCRTPKEYLFAFAQDLFVASEFPVLFTPLLLLDAFLYKKLHIRFQPSYFTYFRHWRSFVDSAVSLGLTLFIFLAVAALLIPFFIPLPSLPLAVTLFSLPLAIYGMFQIPEDRLYHLENGLFRLQRQLLWRLRKKKITLTSLPTFLIPLNEKADYLSPSYPLLKWTHGFTGKKQFNLSLPPKPNVVILFLESFRAHDVNSRVTPCFERLKSQGVYFSNFYSNGILTHQAVISTLFSLYPFFGSIREHSLYGEPKQSVDFSALPLIGMADFFRANGYRTAYFDASLSRSSEKKFFLDHGFDVVKGRHDFSAPFSGWASSWGIYDQYLMQAAHAYFQSHPEKPLFTVLFTVTNHHPWQTPDDYAFDTFSDISDPIHRKFLCTMRYTDHCLEQFISTLDLDRTLLLILGDHGQGMNEHGMEYLQNSIYEENIHIPLLLLHNSITPTTLHTPSSQIDLLPTLLDLLNFTGLNHSLGTSLLRVTPDHPIFFNNAHIGFSWGCRQGHFKYIHTQLIDSKRELFDLSVDRFERHPLPPSSLSNTFEQFSSQTYHYISSLFQLGNFTPFSPLTIDCSYQTSLSDAQLHALLRDKINITTLNLTGCLSITDHGLRTIIPYCKNLRTLDLTDCLVTPEALEALRAACPNLQHIKTTNCPFLE